MILLLVLECKNVQKYTLEFSDKVGFNLNFNV